MHFSFYVGLQSSELSLQTRLFISISDVGVMLCYVQHSFEVYEPCTRTKKTCEESSTKCSFNAKNCSAGISLF